MMKRLRPLSRQEVRQLDVQAARDLEMPTLVLMENAGRGAAAWLAELAGGLPDHPRILILCGPGNNGGDGGVVGLGNLRHPGLPRGGRERAVAGNGVSSSPLLQILRCQPGSWPHPWPKK